VIEALAAKGKTPKALETKPLLLEWVEPVYGAFWLLTRHRPVSIGMGGGHYGAIPLSEIAVYLDEAAVVDPIDRGEWIELLTALDAEHMDFLNSKKEPEKT
jgi:hypothetical protein